MGFKHFQVVINKLQIIELSLPVSHAYYLLLDPEYGLDYLAEVVGGAGARYGDLFGLVRVSYGQVTHYLNINRQNIIITC